MVPKGFSAGMDIPGVKLACRRFKNNGIFLTTFSPDGERYERGGRIAG